MSTEQTPEQAPEQTTEQIVEGLYRYTAAQLVAGVRPAEVERKLIEQGLSAELAQTIVNNLVKARSQAAREAGQKNMIYGALWCVGGTVLTVATMAAAKGGAVIFWGAILFGGIQFIRGAIQAGSE